MKRYIRKEREPNLTHYTNTNTKHLQNHTQHNMRSRTLGAQPCELGQYITLHCISLPFICCPILATSKHIGQAYNALCTYVVIIMCLFHTHPLYDSVCVCVCYTCRTGRERESCTRAVVCHSLRCLWTLLWRSVSRGTSRDCTRRPELASLEVWLHTHTLHTITPSHAHKQQLL